MTIPLGFESLIWAEISLVMSSLGFKQNVISLNPICYACTIGIAFSFPKVT